MNTTDFTIIDWTNFYQFLFEHVINLTFLLIKLLITICLLDICEFLYVALDLFVYFLSTRYNPLSYSSYIYEIQFYNYILLVTIY